MFQYELRETIAILVNVLTAIVVIVAIAAVISLKNDIGDAQTTKYMAEQRLRTRYEYNDCDNKVLTVDQVRTSFAEYIKDGLTIYTAVDTNGNGKLDSNEAYYAYDMTDYRKNKSSFTVASLSKSLPTAGTSVAKHNASAGKIDLVQETGANASVRYVARLIYDDLEPAAQENGDYNTNRSTNVTGVLYLRTTETAVKNYYKL